MRVQCRTGARRLAGMAVVVLLALGGGACEQGAPTGVEGGTLQPEAVEAALLGGNGRLRLDVRAPSGGPAVGSLVTLVHNGVGPFQYREVPASGVVEFLNLTNGIQLCAHARSGVALSTPTSTDLYPAAVGLKLDEPKGDSTWAPAVTGPGGTSPIVSKATYLANCVDNPPILIPNGASWVNVTLVHGEVEPMDLAVVDLTGRERRDVQRGLVIGGQSGPDAFKCHEIPWLEDGCDPDVPPGFLMSHTALATKLSFSPGVPFRAEVLDQVEVDNKTVELVATAAFGPTEGSGTVILGGEQLVCDAGDFRKDAVGDASVLDIQGKVKFSIGVLYGEELEPDPTQAVVWFAMTADEGTMRFSTRTVFAGESSTRTFNAEFLVGPGQGVDGAYGCSFDKAWGAGVDLGFEAEAYCSEPVDGMTRVTIIKRGLTPPWSSLEFNVTTKGPGGGDSTEDPDRRGASRAWIPITEKSECTVPGGNDDRFGTRL